MSEELYEYEEEEEEYGVEGEGANEWISITTWLLVWMVAAAALVVFKGLLGLSFGFEEPQWYLYNGVIAVTILGAYAVLRLYTQPRRDDPGSIGTFIKALIILHVIVLLATQLPIQAEI